MADNEEIQDLERRWRRLNDEMQDVEQAIAALRRQCDHERDHYPGAWWCKKCGGEVPKPETEGHHAPD